MLFYKYPSISSIVISSFLTENGGGCYSHPEKNTYSI